LSTIEDIDNLLSQDMSSKKRFDFEKSDTDKKNKKDVSEHYLDKAVLFR
jgi:hypothetical protein